MLTTESNIQISVVGIATIFKIMCILVLRTDERAGATPPTLVFSLLKYQYTAM